MPEPKLRGSLSKQHSPNPKPQWDPWREELLHKPEKLKATAPLREPALRGALNTTLPPSRVRQWDPWSHHLPKGVLPPDGYNRPRTTDH